MSDFSNLCERLHDAAKTESAEAIDFELFLDAELAIKTLLVIIENKESIISNQRNKIWRLQTQEEL
jgi:hypothetical protein